MRHQLAPCCLTLTIFLLAGCAKAPIENLAPPDALENTTPPDAAHPAMREEAPELRVGKAWRYESTGMWAQVRELTIVVASATDSGYLLAVEDQAMLEDEIAWDLSYLGHFDRQMRSLRDETYGGEPHRNQLLQFPLEEGTTWDFYDLPVRASRAKVQTPFGNLDGWRIQGESESRRVTVEYSPVVGYVTFFEDYSKSREKPLWALRLIETTNVTRWAWFERGAEVIDGGVGIAGTTPSLPSTLDVGADANAIFAWAIGSAGSHGAVVAPHGTFWAFAGEGETAVKRQWLGSEQGRWAVTGVPTPPDGFVYVQVHALRILIDELS